MPEFDVIPSDATEPVASRALISSGEAGRLARLFKVFANTTRLRLLHMLVREGEVCAGDLAVAVEMKPQAVSNQLQKLVDRGILAPRRAGTNIYYRIVDPCVPVLIERGLCLTECCPEEVVTALTQECCDQPSTPCCDTISRRKNSTQRSKRRGRKNQKRDLTRGQGQNE